MTTPIKQHRIAICGNYGASNVGDEAILDGILRLVREADSNSHITVLSANPDETGQLHGVESVFQLPAGIRSLFRGIFNGTIGKTFKTLKECDLFILGGGGLFTDEKPMAIIIWSIQAAFARLFKKPVFCLGQSVGPLMTSFGRIMTKRVFERSAVITVRDTHSAKLLHNLGVKHAIPLADPAFALHAPAPQEKRENYVVFTFRPWMKGKSELLYKNCAQFVDWLWREKGLRSVFVPFQLLHDSDTEVLSTILAHVQEKQAVEMFEFTQEQGKILELMSRAKAVVGMRLHSLIFSTLVQTPFLALSYSTKVAQLMEDMKLGQFVLRWEDLSFQELQDRFECLLIQYDYVRDQLEDQTIFMRERAMEHVGIIRKACTGL